MEIIKQIKVTEDTQKPYTSDFNLYSMHTQPARIIFS